MSEDPLQKYYAVWIKNCEDSIKWLESPDYEDFFKKRNIPVPSEEHRLAKIKDCHKKIAQYKAALK